MKKLLYFLLLFTVFNTTLNGQILEPVKWSTTVEKISDSDFDLVIKASIDKGWHLYAQSIPDDGPIPTTFSFQQQKDIFQLVGNPTEEKGVQDFDKVFEMNIKYFENSATFKQRIRVLTNENIEIVGTVEFMVCDDMRCLPPTEEEIVFSVQGKAGEKLEVTIDEDEKIIPQTQKVEDQVAQATKKEEKKSRGLLTIFIIAFFSGFAALLTPCVFPMIPMTVSFFTKQSKSRAAGIKNAIIYGIAIIAIYVLLGSLVTGIFGADSLNALSTNVWFNIIFFLLLVIFAISFFGAFELVLPSSWSTKVDAQADRGGVIGIIFMALALAIVSFSCTGPIVGTLLVEAASKGGIAPIVGMLGFSLAIALPFALFAAFPGWLNSLPKSGGWLNTVKVSLGFLELALAFKFLSNADLVLQLHWLEREVFLAIWIAIFGAFALYLFGKIKLPHDSSSENISVTRLTIGLIVLTFTIYLIPGLWGAPLKMISGFPPPMQYSESPHGVGFTKTGGGGVQAVLPEGAKYGPHDIITFLDYEKGMAYAKEINKPVLLDFTGHACLNCRKME
ncbi:MAG: protein-disulfide reductase DsbD family protein, partial [Flavobacteriaceae bacterium]|nr:protein-disulfide reductase DsbD family protein [Flavobacteriaceae bacterium]